MTPLMARVTSATVAPARPACEARAHGVLQYREFLADHRPRLADDGGAADLRELAAVARRELGENNVADVEHALAGGANGEIVLRRAHQQEIILGAEFLHEAIELGGKLELADAGPRVFEEPLVAALGDPGRALRGLQVPQACARARDRAPIRRRPSASAPSADAMRSTSAPPSKDSPTETVRDRSRRCVPDHALERRGEIVGADGAIGR